MTSQADNDGRAQHPGLVTRQFRALQGYKLFPWVPAMLLWWGSEAGVLHGTWWLWAFGAAVALAAGGTWWVGRWYDRTYGRIRRRSEPVTRTVGAGALVLVASRDCPRATSRLTWPSWRPPRWSRSTSASSAGSPRPPHG